MNWLLIFVPIAIGLEFLAPERYLLVFATSALAILSLAGWMGHATEQLAERMGEGVGGLLNATLRQRRRTHHYACGAPRRLQLGGNMRARGGPPANALARVPDP